MQGWADSMEELAKGEVFAINVPDCQEIAFCGTLLKRPLAKPGGRETGADRLPVPCGCCRRCQNPLSPVQAAMRKAFQAGRLTIVGF